MHKRLFWIIIPAFAAGIFFGYTTGSRKADVRVFTAGYDAAMNHVRSTIEAKTPDLVPFYMSDLGIKFIPLGGNNMSLRFIGTSDSLNGLNSSNSLLVLNSSNGLNSLNGLNSSPLPGGQR
jgi:hypothetical protein